MFAVWIAVRLNIWVNKLQTDNCKLLIMFLSSFASAKQRYSRTLSVIGVGMGLGGQVQILAQYKHNMHVVCFYSVSVSLPHSGNQLDWFFEIALSPHRNAYALYLSLPKVQNRVGIVTPLHLAYTESGVRRGGLVLPDDCKVVSERPSYLRSPTTPKNRDHSISAQTGSRNMAVIPATEACSKTSC